MKREIEQLQVEASYSNNNLAGARYENAKGAQMDAVARKYNTMIEIEQQNIDRLHVEDNNLKDKH